MNSPRSLQSRSRFRRAALDRRLAEYATAGKALVVVGAAAAGAQAQIMPIESAVLRNTTTYSGPSFAITAAIQHSLVVAMFQTLYSGHNVSAKAGAWSVYHSQH